MGKDPVPYEAITNSGFHANFSQTLGECKPSGCHAVIGLGPHNDFQQPHDMGRRKEMKPYDILRTRCGGSDFIKIKVGSVARKNGARLTNFVQLSKNVLLDIHIFKDGFNHKINLIKRAQL